MKFNEGYGFRAHDCAEKLNMLTLKVLMQIPYLLESNMTLNSRQPPND